MHCPLRDYRIKRNIAIDKYNYMLFYYMLGPIARNEEFRHVCQYTAPCVIIGLNVI